jgi:hypothetical protein
MHNLTLTPHNEEKVDDSISTGMTTNFYADMQPHEEEAADKIIEYLIQTGARPSVNAKGDIVEIVTAITIALRNAVPDHLSHPLKIFTDYIARWLCDYIENTAIQSLRINFGFDAQLGTEGDA